MILIPQRSSLLEDSDIDDPQSEDLDPMIPGGEDSGAGEVLRDFRMSCSCQLSGD